MSLPPQWTRSRATWCSADAVLGGRGARGRGARRTSSELDGPYTAGMSQPGSRCLTPRSRVVAQVAMVVVYLAGVAVPYLVKFTFQGTDHCSQRCKAPADVFSGPFMALVIPTMFIAYLGPM